MRKKTIILITAFCLIFSVALCMGEEYTFTLPSRPQPDAATKYRLFGELKKKAEKIDQEREAAIKHQQTATTRNAKLYWTLVVLEKDANRLLTLIKTAKIYAAMQAGQQPDRTTAIDLQDEDVRQQLAGLHQLIREVRILAEPSVDNTEISAQCDLYERNISSYIDKVRIDNWLRERRHNNIDSDKQMKELAGQYKLLRRKFSKLTNKHRNET